MDSAIQNMVDLFESDNSAAVLQIDIANVFNSNIFLYNIKVICPEISNFVINYYTLPSRLFVKGKGELKSQKGAMQGNPIAIALYALSVPPLMTAVTSPSESMHHSSSNAFYIGHLQEQELR